MSWQFMNVLKLACAYGDNVLPASLSISPPFRPLCRFEGLADTTGCSIGITHLNVKFWFPSPLWRIVQHSGSELPHGIPIFSITAQVVRVSVLGVPWVVRAAKVIWSSPSCYQAVYRSPSRVSALYRRTECQLFITWPSAAALSSNSTGTGHPALRMNQIATYALPNIVEEHHGRDMTVHVLPQ